MGAASAEAGGTTGSPGGEAARRRRKLVAVSLVGRPERDLHVVIKVDTSRFVAALKDIESAWTSLPPRTRNAVLNLVRPIDRARSREVTRRKQRRRW